MTRSDRSNLNVYFVLIIVDGVKTKKKKRTDMKTYHVVQRIYMTWQSLCAVSLKTRFLDFSKISHRHALCGPRVLLPLPSFWRVTKFERVRCAPLAPSTTKVTQYAFTKMNRCVRVQRSSARVTRRLKVSGNCLDYSLKKNRFHKDVAITMYYVSYMIYRKKLIFRT